MRQLAIVAAAEFREGLRNRWVLASILVLGALAFALALLGSAPVGETRVPALSVTTVSLASLSVYLIPLIALTASYDAVVGERERGTLLLLLTYPVRRWQILLGKFLGHCSIIALAIALGYGSAGLFLAVRGDIDSGHWAQFAALLGSSLLLGAVFIALACLISVCTRSRAAAAGIAIGLWLLLVVIYDLLLIGLVVGGRDGAIGETLFRTLVLLNPADTYRLFNLTGSAAAALVSGGAGLPASSLPTPGVLLLILGAWILLPLLLALLVFQRSDA